MSETSDEKKNGDQQKIAWLSVEKDGRISILGYGSLEIPSHIIPGSAAIEVVSETGAMHLSRSQIPEGVHLPSQVSNIYMSPRKDLIVAYDGSGIARYIAVRYAERWMVAEYPIEASPRPFSGCVVRLSFKDKHAAEKFLCWLYAKAKPKVNVEEEDAEDITELFSESPVILEYE